MFRHFFRNNRLLFCQWRCDLTSWSRICDGRYLFCGWLYCLCNLMGCVIRCFGFCCCLFIVLMFLLLLSLIFFLNVFQMLIIRSDLNPRSPNFFLYVFTMLFNVIIPWFRRFFSIFQKVMVFFFFKRSLSFFWCKFRDSNYDIWCRKKERVLRLKFSFLVVKYTNVLFSERQKLNFADFTPLFFSVMSWIWAKGDYIWTFFLFAPNFCEEVSLISNWWEQPLTFYTVAFF